MKSSEPTTVVQPLPQTTAVVQPSPQPTTVVQPLPQTTAVVQPSPQPTTVVQAFTSNNYSSATWGR